MKFRVFDGDGKEVDTFCLLNSTGNLLIPEFSNIGPVDFKVAEGYTVRFEPDYRVCGNCIKCNPIYHTGNGTNHHMCSVKNDALVGKRIDIAQIEVDRRDNPCDHWEFCGMKLQEAT